MQNADSARLRTRVRDAVAYVTLGRGAPLDDALLHGLDEAVATAEADPDVRSIVIAVADEPLGPLGAGPDALLALLARLDGGSKRVYAALGAPAVGTRVEIALACDAIYGSPASGLAFPAAAPPTAGSRAFERARALAGKETAEALVTGTPFSATDAYTTGLFDGILVGDLLEDIAPFARREAALPRGRYHATPTVS